MTEDEREHLLSTVGQAHASLSEAALKLRLGLPPNTPARKTAMKAERAAFELKRALQRLDVKGRCNNHPAGAVVTGGAPRWERSLTSSRCRDTTIRHDEP